MLGQDLPAAGDEDDEDSVASKQALSGCSSRWCSPRSQRAASLAFGLPWTRPPMPTSRFVSSMDWLALLLLPEWLGWGFSAKKVSDSCHPPLPSLLGAIPISGLDD